VVRLLKKKLTIGKQDTILRGVDDAQTGLLNRVMFDNITTDTIVLTTRLPWK